MTTASDVESVRTISVPDGWTIQRLGNLATFQVGAPFSSQFFATDGSGIRLIRNADLKSLSAVVGYTGPFDEKYVVQNGDLLIGMDGDFVPCTWRQGRALLNQRVGRLHCGPDLDRGYASLALSKYLKAIEARTSATTVKHLSHHAVQEIEIVTPPLEEQERIGSALDDVDQLNDGLERLITKKREVMRGAMQSLLSGARRLPGRTAVWQQRTIGDLGELIAGGTPSTANPRYWGGSVAWCTPTDITSCSGRVLSSTERSITEDGLESSSATLLPVGSLLLCTRATVGEVKIAAMPVATNQGFRSLVVSPENSRDFVYYKLQMLKSVMRERATGTTFLEIGRRDLSEISVSVPDKGEQSAIAEVLSDMDEEIEALEKRLAKTRDLKLGMAQELLSGRTRLV